MYSKVSQVLSAYVRKNDTLIVGVSGGPDSTALLRILAEFSTQISCKIIVAHVNHGIRGRESDKDEKFVKNLAKSHKLKCKIARVNLSKTSGQEEKGREIRRAFFEKLLAKYGAKFIVTAHTQDDQIETIIFNFLRGSGPAGLAGMSTLNGAYLKPLLGIPKKEILQYLKLKKLKFCSDKSNADTKYSRNFIRAKILPLCARVNPNFQKTILRNGAIFGELANLLKAETRVFLKKHSKDGFLFHLKDFEKLPEALKSEVIQEAYRSSAKTSYSLSTIKVQEILKLIERRIGNKRILYGEKGGFLVKKGGVYLLK